MKKIFYEKVGRRYKQVSEYDSDLFDSLSEGAHLVIVSPGRQSRQRLVNPDLAPMIAAGKYAEDAISQAIMNRSMARPSERKEPLNKKQKAAWDNFVAAMDGDLYALEYCSYREAAEFGVKAMQKEAEKLLSNHAVRQAYDHFMLLCELTKQTEESK